MRMADSEWRMLIRNKTQGDLRVAPATPAAQ